MKKKLYFLLIFLLINTKCVKDDYTLSECERIFKIQPNSLTKIVITMNSDTIEIYDTFIEVSATKHISGAQTSIFCRNVESYLVFSFNGTDIGQYNVTNNIDFYFSNTIYHSNDFLLINSLINITKYKNIGGLVEGNANHILISDSINQDTLNIYTNFSAIRHCDE